MARNKLIPKPLFSVKHDFIDSLEVFIQASMMLHLSIKSALDIGGIKDGALATTLRERCDAWEKATLSDGDAP